MQHRTAVAQLLISDIDEIKPGKNTLSKQKLLAPYIHRFQIKNILKSNLIKRKQL
ncbi:hypothetical protein [Comamonas sp.]